MKRKKIFLLAFSCLLLGASTLQGQEAMVAAGGQAKTAETQLNWTMGEGFVETFIVGSHAITQGLLQPEITVATLSTKPALEYDITAFPNPARDFLHVKLTKMTGSKLICKLYDINGRQVLEQEIQGMETRLPIKLLVDGSYLLTISDELGDLTTFKIIKQ